MDNGSDIVPSFGSSSDGIVLRNREYVRDLYCPNLNNAFQVVDSVPLNPGLVNSFPWLSQVAANYEEYEFLQLAVTFKSTINPSIATNGQVGQVCIATNYNPDQDSFGSKEEMISYSGGMSAKTSSSMIHGVECDPAKNSGTAGKYVRPGFVEGTKKDYDLGNTYVAVLNAPDDYLGQCLGELWISYTVTLRKPRITVADNYLLPANTVCCSTTPYPTCFGIQNDGELKVSTKATLPVEFLLPSTSSAPYDLIPVTTATIFQDMILAQTASSSTGTNPPLWIAVKFPAWYSGIVEFNMEIRWRMTASITAETIYAQAQGQIFRYQDIPWDAESGSGSGATPVWTHKTSLLSSTSGSPSLADTQFLRLHVRVQPSLNGIDNIVYFGATISSTVPTSCYHSMLTVNGLNTYLSKDDSKQGTIAQSRAGAYLPLTNYTTGTAALYP